MDDSYHSEMAFVSLILQDVQQARTALEESEKGQNRVAQKSIIVSTIVKELQAAIAEIDH